MLLMLLVCYTTDIFHFYFYLLKVVENHVNTEGLFLCSVVSNPHSAAYKMAVLFDAISFLTKLEV